MCEHHKSIQEVERAIEDVQRPMRWKSSEAIAKKLSREVLDTYVELEKEFYDVLRGIDDRVPSYQTILSRGRRQERKKAEKRFNITRQELQQELNRLLGIIRSDQVQALANVFDAYLPRLIEIPDDLATANGVFNKYMREYLQDGYDNAYARLTKAAREQGARQQFIDFNVPAALALDSNSAISREVTNRGFRFIRHKLTIDAKGRAMRALATGLESGLDWTDITDSLHKEIGVGYHWHWKRLIRTEMTYGYYEAFLSRYQGAGVQYVSLSTSMGACPICIGLRGIYQMGTQPPVPQATHPNCRCVYTPYFRLPEGADISNFDHSTLIGESF